MNECNVRSDLRDLNPFFRKRYSIGFFMPPSTSKRISFGIRRPAAKSSVNESIRIQASSKSRKTGSSCTSSRFVTNSRKYVGGNRSTGELITLFCCLSSSNISSRISAECSLLFETLKTCCGLFSVASSSARLCSSCGHQTSKIVSKRTESSGSLPALFMLWSNFNTSFFSGIVDWNCNIGPAFTSDRFRPTIKAETLALSIAFDNAPASKFSHGDSVLSAVTHKIPYLEASSSAAISVLQRAPLSISSDET